MRVDRGRLEQRVAAMAAIGGGGTSVTRLGLSREEEAARELVGGWLAARGARVRLDAAGNVFGRFGGDGPAVLVGSHIDSVPRGGRFDGALGVCCAVEAVETLLDAGLAPERPMEVVGWADEEGVRFGIGLFGSAAAFGRLPPGAAERRDAQGISIAEALRALGRSGDPAEARRPPADFAAYLEPHIEQGPQLADRGAALGIVTSIVGIVHGRVTVRGRQDHAGTTAMDVRRDALAGAARMISALEEAARRRAYSVATVGEIAVSPGAKNVVPGECTFSIDVRAPDDQGVAAVRRDFEEAMRAEAERRGLDASLDLLADVRAAPMDERLRDVLRRAAAAVGVDAPDLISGAGHDAQNAHHAGVPTAMLFIRSSGGSHSPREFAAPHDYALGAGALAAALRELSRA